MHKGKSTFIKRSGDRDMNKRSLETALGAGVVNREYLVHLQRNRNQAGHAGGERRAELLRGVVRVQG